MSERQTRWRQLRRGGRFALFVLAVLAISYNLVTGSESIFAFQWEVKPTFLIVGIVCYVAFFLGRGAVWVYGSRVISIDIPLVLGLRTYTISYLTRYVPGAIWPFLTIADLAEALGVSRRNLLMMFTVNIILVLVIDTLYVLPFIYALYGLTGALVNLVVFALGIYFSPLWLVFFLTSLQRIRLVHPDLDLGTLLRRRHLYRLLLATVFHQIIEILSYYFVIYGLLDISADVAGYLTLSYAIAWLLGLLVLFVPQGLGVREFTFVLLASPFLSQPIAIALSVVLRLLTMLAELLALLVLVLPVFSVSSGNRATQTEDL